MAVPLSVSLRRADGSIAGEDATFDQLDLVVRWRDVSRWTLVASHPEVVSFFADRDVGVVVRRGDATVLSGPVDYKMVQQDGTFTRLTVSGPDDTTHLAGTLAWPLPSAAVGSQTDAYDKRSGPAETVLLAYADANLSRLGQPVTVPASSGRGATVRYRARFTSLLEVCQQVVSSSPSLGFRIVQQPDRTQSLQVWEASDLTRSVHLSDESGAVLDWQYVEQWPEVTRVVVGGGDEKAARVFRSRSDTSAESAWDRVVEVFEDRRDIDPADATATDEMDEHGDTTLADRSASQTLRVSFRETAGWVFGSDFGVGDLVRAYPAGVRVDDRITEAVVTVTSDGESTELWVGQKDSDPDERVERRARRFERRLRQLERAY